MFSFPSFFFFSVIHVAIFVLATYLAFQLIAATRAKLNSQYYSNGKKQRTVRLTLRGATIFAILIASLIRAIYFAVDPIRMRKIWNDAANDSLNGLVLIVYYCFFFFRYFFFRKFLFFSFSHSDIIMDKCFCHFKFILSCCNFKTKSNAI
jgi:hypothetical protein